MKIWFSFQLFDFALLCRVACLVLLALKWQIMLMLVSLFRLLKIMRSRCFQLWENKEPHTDGGRMSCN